MNGQVSTSLNLTSKGYEKLEEVELGVAAEREEKY